MMEAPIKARLLAHDILQHGVARIAQHMAPREGL